MRWRNINTGMLLNSLANVGRSLVNPLFIALISYLFLKMDLPGELQAINKITALINLLLVFSGWGLKDYLVKESVRLRATGPGNDFNSSWHLAFASKLPLLAGLAVISFIVLAGGSALFVVAIAVFRTYNALYEPLVILHKKNLLFFLLDGFSAVVLAGSVFLGIVRSYAIFFCLLAVAELVKTLIAYFIFRLPARYPGSFRQWLGFLKETRFYFLLVLVSFFQSRVDLYVLGFLFSPGKLNEYQLLSSLLALSQVIIAAYVVSYSKLLYRNIRASERSFRRLLLLTGGLVALGASVFIYVLLNYLYQFNFSPLSAFIVAWNGMAFAWTLYEMYYYTKLNWLNRVLLFLFLSGLFNFALCLLLIGPLEVTGALLANTGSMTLLGLLMFWRRAKMTRELSA